VTDAAVHDSQAVAGLVARDDAPQPVYADSAYAGKEIAQDLEKKGVIGMVHERAYRNTPLTEEQKASNREKSKVRVRVEHVFGFMTKSMGALVTRAVGARRAAGCVGLMNLVYNLCRYEQIRRLELLPAAARGGTVP
jgi:IS5 family transposase